MIKQQEIEVATSGRGCYDLSRQIDDLVQAAAIETGLCHVFIRHTSASLVISENADPAVMHDLEAYMARAVPDGDPIFTHTAEGPDDMPSHVRSVLTQTDLSVPVRNGKCALGTWQGIYLWEHRLAPHRRKVLVTISGE